MKSELFRVPPFRKYEQTLPQREMQVHGLNHEELYHSVWLTRIFINFI